MAKEAKERERGSSMVIVLSVLLALGAGGGVWYCWDEAQKSEALLLRSKDEYKKMAERKKPVEEYLRSKKGRKDASPADPNMDMMVFLDKKAREAQIPQGRIVFAKNTPAQIGTWTETSFTATLTSEKDNAVKKLPVVEFLRKVEAEARSTKVKALQLVYAGDDFKSATITFSQFAPK